MSGAEALPPDLLAVSMLLALGVVAITGSRRSGLTRPPDIQCSGPLVFARWMQAYQERSSAETSSRVATSHSRSAFAGSTAYAATPV